MKLCLILLSCTPCRIFPFRFHHFFRAYSTQLYSTLSYHIPVFPNTFCCIALYSILLTLFFSVEVYSKSCPNRSFSFVYYPTQFKSVVPYSTSFCSFQFRSVLFPSVVFYSISYLPIIFSSFHLCCVLFS